jgi:hypothetical protein
MGGGLESRCVGRVYDADRAMRPISILIMFQDVSDLFIDEDNNSL